MNVTFTSDGAAGMLLYMLPAIVALIRGNEDTTEIAWVNFLLGWTGIGWIVCLIWAFKKDADD